MSIYTSITYILFSIILSIILNKLEKEKKDNFFDYIIISNIYILILSGLFRGISNNIFLVIFLQIIGNVLYVTYIKEISIINNQYDILKYILCIISTYLLNILFINKVDSVFLNLEQVKFIIWVFIIGYLYFNLKDNFKVNKLNNNKKLYYQDTEYIVMQYAKFKSKYYNVVSSKYRDLNLLIYSIMIYENYNRPSLFRKFDKFRYKLFSKRGKFGIMQINSNKYIDDITSIKLTIKKLERCYVKNNDIYKTIASYYKVKKREVLSIYNELSNFDKK